MCGCCASDANEEREGLNSARSHDPEFRGPVKNRSCTDVICCILFIVFFLVLIFIAVWAFAFGDIRRVIFPTDSKGQVCGISKGLEKRNRLVFFNLLSCAKLGPAVFIKGCPTEQVCVERCPDYFWAPSPLSNRKQMICEGGKTGDDSPFNSQSVLGLTNSGKCAPLIVPTISLAHRCLPDITKILPFSKRHENLPNTTMNATSVAQQFTSLKGFFNVALYAQKIASDFGKAWKPILVILVIGTAVSLLYVLLLRFIATVMVWLTILLFAIIFSIGTIFAFIRWSQLKDGPSQKLELNINSIWNHDKVWLGTGIASAILLVIILLIILVLRNRIRIAVAIINQTSKSIAHMMSILIWPVFNFIMYLVVIGLCLAILIYLGSVRTPEGVPTNFTVLSHEKESEQVRTLIQAIPCDPLANNTGGKICNFLKYGTQNYIYVMLAFVVFEFLWLICFVNAISQLTLAGAFASYYFAFNKPADIPTFPVAAAFSRSLLYHMGSAAFGSLLLAILKFVRLLLEYLDQKTKQSQNPIATFLVKCLKCCFWCFEKCLKFLTKNAFIMVAIYGKNFCSSAVNAFNLIVRNIVRVFVIDKVTDFVLFIGKLVVVGGIGAFSFFLFNGTILPQLKLDLNYFYLPVIVVIIGTYIIANSFFGIYDMGVDTIFLCFCEDLERNDGSAEKPYFLSKELMKILHKRNEDVRGKTAVEEPLIS